MTPEQQRDYAIKLIHQCTHGMEFMPTLEAVERQEGREISDEDTHAVHDLIVRATVTVSWK